MITIRQYAPLETIVKENEHGETAFVIEKGRVEVTKERDGKRVHIAFLEAGATFGEMSVVDDAPRTATVTAMEETLLREIHRDNIQGAMKESPDAIIKFLKNIFERLREANMRIAQLESAAKAHSPGAGHDQPQANPNPFSSASASVALSAARSSDMEGALNTSGISGVPASAPSFASAHASGNGAAQPAAPAAKPAVYSIEGLTPQAKEAIPDNPFTFTTFPLKIGRKTNDPLVNNHLEIQDQDPLQISRHHVSIVRENGKLGVIDRGSKLGALVDDVHIGGKKHSPGPAFFKGEEGILILGTATSPYRYRIKRSD